jgi:hypothetical protein
LYDQVSSVDPSCQAFSSVNLLRGFRQLALTTSSEDQAMTTAVKGDSKADYRLSFLPDNNAVNNELQEIIKQQTLQIKQARIRE